MSKLVPTRIVLASALCLAGTLLVSPAARAQEVAPILDEAAPPKLGPWTWEATDSHLRVAAALREARRASPGSGAQLQQRIIGSGRDAVAAQVDILLRNRVPETSPKDGPQILSEVQRELLLGALAQMPQQTVRQELDARLAKSPEEVSARLGVIHALGVVGKADDLARLVELAPRKAENPELDLTYSSRQALRNATVALLRRLPQAWQELAAVLRTADPGAATTLLDALGNARDPRALRILLQTARSSPQLKWKAASLVPACGSSLNAETDREFLAWVRAEFQLAQPAYARTLLAAVGTLDDGDWIPTLIERLVDENSGIRSESLAALQRISGLGFPADPAPWRNWYEAESRWHAQRRPQLAKQLSSIETPKIVSAVREYSEHRTRRAELAEELVKVLEHAKPEVRGLVISVLEHLGSPAACSALVALTRDSDAKVGEAAWHALHAISGIELSRDADQLRSLFDRS
jgi:HEAT repeat protein